jgi:NAD(P)-dependent dehydrogenase (short-subunit alcohol dehydrogenase family)
MTKKLQDKVVLITGGTSGIGLATAQLFIEQGAKVIVTGSSAQSVARAEQVLGGAAQAVQADNARLDDIERLIAGIRERHGRLDVLFLNAGIGYFLPFEQQEEEHFDRQFDVNIKGPYFTVQKALPLLGQGASIIFNTSAASKRGVTLLSAYSATKAGLAGLTRALAAELAGRGIRVNALGTGPTETPIFERAGIAPQDVPGVLESYGQGTVFKRVAKPEEIARVALFLASDDASFVTGQELSADGGYTNLTA